MESTCQSMPDWLPGFPGLAIFLAGSAAAIARSSPKLWLGTTVAALVTTAAITLLPFAFGVVERYAG